MLREAENIVRIEGILSEIDIKPGSYEKDGKTVETIGGSIKVKVEQKINGELKTLEVPVQMFSNKYTKAGQLNPAYESIEKVMKEYVSIAAAGGEDGADRIRITKAKLQMNEYYGSPDKLISFPRITTSFVNRIKKEDCKPDASFVLEFVVANQEPEIKNDAETGRHVMTAVVPQYGEKVDVFTLYAINPNVIDVISSYWADGDTVKAQGKLNFSSKTETYVEEVDFGEPNEVTRTVNVSELIITGGSQSPMEGEFAYDTADIQKGLADRKARLEAQKEKDLSRTKQKKAPAKTAAKGGLDVGF